MNSELRSISAKVAPPKLLLTYLLKDVPPVTEKLMLPVACWITVGVHSSASPPPTEHTTTESPPQLFTTSILLLLESLRLRSPDIGSLDSGESNESNGENDFHVFVF